MTNSNPPKSPEQPAKNPPKGKNPNQNSYPNQKGAKPGKPQNRSSFSPANTHRTTGR